MKHFITCLSQVFIIASLILILQTPNINARIVYQYVRSPPPSNYPPPQVLNFSYSKPEAGGHEDGVFILSSFSKIFLAISALEMGDIETANNKMKEVSHDLKNIANYINNRRSNIEKRPISTKNLSSEKLKIIKKDLLPFGGKIPQDFYSFF